MSVLKTTSLTHGARLEFRVEAYNALNHTELGQPNTTFVAGAPLIRAIQLQNGVVIPTRPSERSLLHCLRALCNLAQNYFLAIQ
ncbi:hypothetical protein, partial [Terriglobus sp. ADX1]|uniref:hypothetical protein n=1 Tax=Terriglobus sp. ADX1 TaxID=2794063 RepID=UPI003FCDD664